MGWRGDAAVAVVVLAALFGAPPAAAFSPAPVKNGGALSAVVLQRRQHRAARCRRRAPAPALAAENDAGEDFSGDSWQGAEGAEAGDGGFEGFWAHGSGVVDEDVIEGFGLGGDADAALQTRLRKVRRRDAHRALFARLSHCHVLVFDADTEAEGLYCVEQGGLNIVLGFESEQDAEVYGAWLQRQGFFNPEPRRTSVTEMIAFCWDSDNVKLKLVPRGTKLVPPKLNQPVLGDWAAEAPTLTEADLTTLRDRLERLVQRDADVPSAADDFPTYN
uniref:Uncharacterized protein n=1 Tax=Phaeomonas parva TaxID=124430 RepID=A0A6U4CWC9_9STRA|mmetsp:Transcript_15441/g.46626  ORF Transcript_15441/g.46626 Transcript_15441/m.46626 type:complete len:275 (+) Transcript_15441:215-1039(+)|eukprot:CAMPEP_0118859682 /NCGR_PEP_ID=MMETSP1163-20130328/5829_1 /TAXON_ID=124430 /ORGANISM="Phaeomonas parva, Strain CCMP2877" /LENGTH=274 /DNA_ID=CAMNT_0006793307 /DNA_START=185 /DNA_END=1009 /DNA_ORIENTATION=-